MFFLTTDGVLWKILFFMILFYVFYVIPMMLLYPDVTGDYSYEVRRCNEPLVSWQIGQPIFLFFINYVNVTDVYIMSQSQMLLGLIIYLCYMVHDVIMEPCGYLGSPGPSVVGCYLSFSSGEMTSTSSHICDSWYLSMFLFRDGSLTD